MLAVRAQEAARVRQDAQLHRAQALTELGEAVASIAHEINNPLASVVAYADLLGTAPGLRPEDRDDLATMAREAQRAAGIARGLLARPAATSDGALEILRQRLAKGEITKEQFEELRKKHPQPDIRMMSTSESAMPGEYSFTLTFMFWNPRYEPRIPIL